MLPFQIPLADFGLLFAGFGVAVAALHLLHRKQRTQVVSTLRFWTESKSTSRVARPRIDQPWSLLLHLLALALLLLAITDAPWEHSSAYRHVLVLDTSARARDVLLSEKNQLREYVRQLPSEDKFQLVEADGVASPVTGFTDDRGELGTALREARSSDTALDWGLVSAYADTALHAGPERPGRVAYFGPGPSLEPAATCSEQMRTVRVGVSSDRSSLWAAAVAAMPHFAYSSDWRSADVVIYDGRAAEGSDARPALLVNPPSHTRIDTRDDVVLRFDPFAGGARFDAHAALALRNALDQVAGAGGMARGVSAGLIELPVAAESGASPMGLLSSAGPVPFAVRDGMLRAYVDRAGPLDLETPDERLSLCMATQNAASGLPSAPKPPSEPGRIVVWRWLAVLAALVLISEWWLFSRHSSGLLLLKAAGVLAIALALCGFEVRTGRQPTALLVLIDRSASIGPHAAERAEEYAARSGLATLRSFGSRSETNIESAVMQAIASAPEGLAPRVRLLTDGNETEGAALRAAFALKRSGVPVDAVPIGAESNAVQIRSMSVPRNAFAGETFPVTVSVECPQDLSSQLRLFARGKEIGHSDFSCHAGSNRVELQTRIRSAGAMVVSATAGSSRFDEAMVLETPRALYVSGDVRTGDANLVHSLSTAGFSVTQAADLPEHLQDFQLVIVNNIDMDGLSGREQSALGTFVEAGGGLLVVSGEHQTYHDRKELNAIDRVLPATVKPPQTPDGISVVLVIDKSSSMEGRKIQLARLSASAVVDHLRPVDTIGILIFDNAFSWVATPRLASDKPSIKRLIAGIVPDGGTQIPTAVEEAYRKILATKAAYKHIVLLTDGISEEGDSLALAEDAAAHQVTISTIGLGQDVNKTYLEKLADASGGQNYFLDDPSRLRELLLKDIEKVQAKTAVEVPVNVVKGDDGGLLKDVDLRHAPALHGYVRYEARPGARTLMTVNDHKRDPLLSEWGYGLGRVAVFSSDAKSRWAADWVSWRGFDAFWTDVALQLAKRGSEGRMDVRMDRDRSELVAEFRGAQAPEKYYYFGPAGIRGALRWQRTAMGFEGKARVRWAPGLWVVRSEQEGTGTPEVGLLAREAEARDRGVNEALLRNLTQITGGVYSPLPDYVPNAKPRSTPVVERLWPLLLWLALGLMLAELTVRKVQEER